MVRGAGGCGWMALAFALGALTPRGVAAEDRDEGPKKTEASVSAKAHPETTTPSSPAADTRVVRGKPTKTLLPADGSERDLGPLAADMAELSEHWSEVGPVARLEPRLLFRGDRRQLFLPSEATDPTTPTCATVAVLGTGNVGFLMVFDQHHVGEQRRVWPVPSSAGAAEVTRCGARKSLLEGLSVQMRSPRGVLETMIVMSVDPPPPLAEVLAGRDPGPSLSSPSVGPRPELTPVSSRVKSLVLRARNHGANVVRESAALADRTGRGAAVIHLDTGCHEVAVLGPASTDGAVDIDATLSTLAQDEVLVSDENESGQAHLRWCVGRPTRVRLTFVGAAANSEVALIQSRWDLPRGLPVEWGPVARARLAQTLTPQELRLLTESPVYSSLGVQGITRLPIEVEPGACYVVGLATIRGMAAIMAVGAQSGATFRENQTGQVGDGIALSFCTAEEEKAVIDVRSTGTGLAWLLGVWQTGRLPWGDPALPPSPAEGR